MHQSQLITSTVVKNVIFFKLIDQIVLKKKSMLGAQNKSLFGTHFCKIIFMFLKQNLRALSKKFMFGTPVSILFLKFFLWVPRPFSKQL